MGRCQEAMAEQSLSPNPPLSQDVREKWRDLRKGQSQRVSTGPHMSRQRGQKTDSTFPFPFRCFLLGGQKPGAAEFLGALQTSPIPNFPKCFVPKLCPKKKIPEETEVLTPNTWVWEPEVCVETNSLFLPGKCCQIEEHANIVISSGL